MKRPGALEPTLVFVEIRPASLHAWTGMDGVDLALERGADGRLTPDSISRATSALKALVAGKPWLSRAQICCAIGSRGVLLRSIPLPAASLTDVPRLLQLQIESEFPLPPESLAWGWMPIVGTGNPPDNQAGPPRQQVLVAAVRKEVIEEYASLIEPGGVEPFFTLAALARAALVSAEPGSFAVLELGPTQSELIVAEAGTPPSVQLLPWGENRVIDSLVARSGQTRDEALARLEAAPGAPVDEILRAVLDEGTGQLLRAIPTACRDRPLWISGPPGLVALLIVSLGQELSARILPVASGPGRTAATLGLARIIGQASNGGPLPLPALRVKQPDAPDRMVRSFPKRQAMVAAALLFGVLAFPFIEALFVKPSLARKVAALKAGTAHFAAIDREFGFLRFLEINQAPHLDATYVIAQAAPPGARITSLSLNRSGEVALTGSLRDLIQVGDFRLKLINSGFFSSVVLEDQTPTPDRQKINFRITSRWKPSSERESLSLGPVLPEPKAGKSGVTNSPAKTNPPAATAPAMTPSVKAP